MPTTPALDPPQQEHSVEEMPLAELLQLAAEVKASLAGCAGKLQAIYAAAEAARAAAAECATGGQTLTELVQDATALRSVSEVYIAGGRATFKDCWQGQAAVLAAAVSLGRLSETLCISVRESEAAGEVTALAAQVGKDRGQRTAPRQGQAYRWVSLQYLNNGGAETRSRKGSVHLLLHSVPNLLL